MAVSDYSTAPGSNTSISGINIAEGCSPANLNNAIRQLMADVRSFYDGLTIGSEIQAYDAGLQQIADLADPNADRILFWDDSAGAYTYLTVGTNLSISGTTLSATDQTPADGSITFAKLAGAAVITSGEVLFSNDNDTSLPTSAAMIDAVGAIAVFQDQKAANTDGGGFTSGAWRTRTLNTTVSNNITGASLASNQITLPAGTYRINASAPALRVNNHQSRLQNITDGTTVLQGTTEISEQSGAIVQSRSFIRGVFTLSGTKALEIQHQCTTTFSGAGFGSAANFGDEVYTTVEIQRIA